MDQQSNPYASPESPSDGEPLRIPAVVWPRTTLGCIVLALVFWPMVMLAMDLVGMLIEPLVGIDDFGVAVVDFTLPISWLFAIVLWFRGFLIQKRSIASVFYAVITFPLWLIPTAIWTFMNFPFGRIDPNF